MTTVPKVSVKIRPETRAKLEAIATAKRWKFGVAIDEAIDSFILREGIKVEPAANQRRRQTAQA